MQMKQGIRSPSLSVPGRRVNGSVQEFNLRRTNEAESWREERRWGAGFIFPCKALGSAGDWARLKSTQEAGRS